MERSLGRDHGEALRDEMVQKDRIAALLREGPLTIPEIAERLSAPSHEVVFWVMALRRYGHLEESAEADDDGYRRYGLKERGED